ncbi:MAG: hypothetical protein O2894_00925 [Planctomycetota bacterium]|nr:hypothetical protein [Planctomycetota bacterium]
MPWKTEIDRIVIRNVADAGKGGEGEIARAQRTLHDLLTLAPDRAESHFHLGAADEILGEAAAELPASKGEAARWRYLGALDAAARRGDKDRLTALLEDKRFEGALGRPEGRVALRAVSRMLLRDGQEERVFGWYAAHLKATEDPEDGSRRDAEFLLEEALRRADRYERGERDEGAALARLERAGAFADSVGLEPRARAKVDRKMGRLHQLGERWDEAVRCYTSALEGLPEDDPYRSVLVGDLALSTLGVRGTLDLLPQEEREARDAAREILLGEAGEGEGRSYNAIYTLGVLHYEDGDFTSAAKCFREADELMRANRAKARIVHARSRFFLGHCLLELGAEGDDLEAAVGYIKRDAGPSNLSPEIKDPVFELMEELAPQQSRPQRGERNERGRRGRGRGEREERSEGDRAGAPAESAADHLAEARRVVEDDPHAALVSIDAAFRSRPDFDTWFGAYRTRLEALVGLNVRDEAVRTYERFRAKLYERSAFEQIESLLLDTSGPLANLLDDRAYIQELIDLYEVMPERDGEFVEQCLAGAQAGLDEGSSNSLACAVAMLREAGERDADAVAGLLKRALKASKEAELDLDEPSIADAKALVAELDEEPHILIVGGDEGRRPHFERFRALGKDVGFEASWIFTGSRPPQKTLEEIEKTAEDSSAILVHHHTDPELRSEILKMAEEMDLPLREASWMGVTGVAAEVLRTLNEAMIEED